MLSHTDDLYDDSGLHFYCLETADSCRSITDLDMNIDDSALTYILMTHDLELNIDESINNTT